MSSWADLRSELVGAFEGFPSVRDEAAVRDAYQAYPAAVRQAASRIRVRVADGRVRDGWRVLALEVARGASAGEGEPASVAAERRARAWLRNEGRHYPIATVREELERRLPGTDHHALRARLLTTHAELTADDGTTGTRHEGGGGADPDRGGPSDGKSHREGVVA